MSIKRDSFWNFMQLFYYAGMIWFWICKDQLGLLLFAVVYIGNILEKEEKTK
jgi:hypothetical protein